MKFVSCNNVNLCQIYAAVNLLKELHLDFQQIFNQFKATKYMLGYRMIYTFLIEWNSDALTYYIINWGGINFTWNYIKLIISSYHKYQIYWKYILNSD